MSTPYKNGNSRDGYTPDTLASKASKVSRMTSIPSPATVITSYSAASISRKAGENELGLSMNGLSLEQQMSRVELEDPFVERDGAQNFSLSATAADYAPVPLTTTHSHAPVQAYSSPSPISFRSSQPNSGGSANSNACTPTRYVMVTGPKDDEAGMTRIKDVSAFIPPTSFIPCFILLTIRNVRCAPWRPRLRRRSVMKEY